MKNVYIIGSLCQEETIKEVAKRLSKGSNVRYAAKVSNKSLTDIITDSLDNIDWADVVVVVPQIDGSLTSSTIYELEYAKRTMKRILFEKKKTT